LSLSEKQLHTGYTVKKTVQSDILISSRGYLVMR
jgi:hypothetical protein